MVNEFCGFKHGVIGTDKMPADTTLNNMKKADLIKLLHTAQHNYETLMWFYNNAVKANMSQLNNNGWILCSERLPEVNTTYLVSLEGYCKPLMAWFGSDKEWYWYNSTAKMDYVIAWQTLPEPFKPKGE